MGNRYSLTISDLAADEVRRIVDVTDDAAASPAASLTDAAEPAKPRRVKKETPATLPAGSTTTAPTPPATPAPAVPDTPTPEPVVAQMTAKATAVDTSGITLDSLVVKARALAAGPLKQMAFVSVLAAMGANSLPKIPAAQHEALNDLLDAATAYGNSPGATLDFLKSACQTGQYDNATTVLHGAVAAAMGL